MNRMADPFEWAARKRRGSTGPQEPAQTTGGPTNANNYDQYFNDDVDFPGFGNHFPFNRGSGGHDNRKRSGQHPEAGSTDRSGFFDYMPAEFRQYIPDSFGFPNARRAAQPHMSATGIPPQPPQRAQQPQQQQQFQQYQQHPVPQQYETAAAPASVPLPTRCDAAIQTEELPLPNDLHQHGLRNTVDMGQKSEPEQVRPENRAQSAPPADNVNQVFATNGAQHSPHPNAEHFANTGTSMTPQASNASTQQSQFNYPNQQAAAPQPTQQSGNFTRTVPIFVEGRDVPVVAKTVPTQQSAAPNQPRAAHPRPEPFVARAPHEIDETDGNLVPPQTPHTTNCIKKIQDIQADVLDLMGKVERFGGARGDREYAYLDEMLTRNLLRLDTIDPNGRENIRLARKEAIKCIQASITVLEAKAELNLQAQQKPDESAPQPDVVSDVVVPEESPVEQAIIESPSVPVESSTEIAAEPAATEIAPAPIHISEVKINIGDSAPVDAPVPLVPAEIVPNQAITTNL